MHVGSTFIKDTFPPKNTLKWWEGYLEKKKKTNLPILVNQSSVDKNRNVDHLIISFLWWRQFQKGHFILIFWNFWGRKYFC